MIHGSVRTNDNDFCLMLDSLRSLGIPHDIHWKPTNVEGFDVQQVIVDQGLNLTMQSTNAVVVGSLMYFFSTGRPQWANDQENGEGVEGTFLFILDTAKKTVIQRVHSHPHFHKPLSDKTGWEAIKVMQEPWANANFVAEAWGDNQGHPYRKEWVTKQL